MHKLIPLSLAFASLLFQACSPSMRIPTTQESSSNADVFTGEIWIKPGGNNYKTHGETLWLHEVTDRFHSTRALSQGRLQRLYQKYPIYDNRGEKRIYYISDEPN